MSINFYTQYKHACMHTFIHIYTYVETCTYVYICIYVCYIKQLNWKIYFSSFSLFNACFAAAHLACFLLAPKP